MEKMDEQTLKECKNYIETTLEKGDVFTTSIIQRRFKTGYNRATRVLKMLADENYIKMDENPVKAPKVIYN